MTNTTFRKRLGLDNSQNNYAWKVINKTIDVGLIKNGDPKSKSRKYIYYVPYWA